MRILGLNRLSPKTDQNHFSPDDTNTQSRQNVVRINKAISLRKIFRSSKKFSQLILYGKVLRSVWRICIWITGLKG